MSKYLLVDQESERMFFRKVRESDFDSWLPFYHDPRSTQFWKGRPSDPREACREQFNGIFERYNRDLGGMNALVLKTSGELVGISGLLVQTVDGMEELEIGYSILPVYWKQGYALEAAVKCKQFAFGEGCSNSLISIIHVDNVPSRKVALKNGMLLDRSTIYKDNPVDIYRVMRDLS